MIPATLPTPQSPRVGESKAVADGAALLPAGSPRRGVIADGAAIGKKTLLPAGSPRRGVNPPYPPEGGTHFQHFYLYFNIFFLDNSITI